jgi:thiol-disulfide isomerase/thioredoxin
MRTVIACVALLILPTTFVILYKSYESATVAPPMPSGGASAEVLFFNASWCGPCRQMKPIVTQMRGQGYHLRDVDVDRNRSLAQRYQIRSVPTFVFLENGREVSRFSGGTSTENLRRRCAAYH